MKSGSKIPFRLGIIGAGAVARTLHVPGALVSPHIIVAAIVDPVLERAVRLAREYGLSCRIAPSMEQVLPFVDGVIIGTPNHTHRDIAINCLAAGVPCLVEKPLATTTADAEEMCRAARQAGKVLAVGYTTRFRDEVLLLYELLHQEYFGAIRRFHYQEGTVGGWSPQSGYTADRKMAGGGVLVVVGTHFIDRMLYWFGYPDRCSLVDDGDGGPEAHCLAGFRFKTWGPPFEGTLLLSKTVQLKPGLVIEADRGDIIFPMGRSPLYFQPRDNSQVRMVLTPRGPRTFPLSKDDVQLELENFVEACREKTPPLVTGEQALQSVRLIEELYRSRSPLRKNWSETRELAGQVT